MKISKIKPGTSLRKLAQSKIAKQLPKAAGAVQGEPTDAHAAHQATAQELRKGGWTHHVTKLGKFWKHAATNRTALNSAEALKMHRATRKP